MNKNNVIKTQVLPAFDLQRDKKAISQGAKLLREGELVIFPTETVYGIGANGFDSFAVQKIFAAKGRPQDNPLIIHLADFDDLHYLVESIPEVAAKLAEKFWPGPLTMIFKKSKLVPDEVSAGLDTVAIRMPSHPVARALIAESGVPVAAPSANRSGSPSPTLAEHSYHDFRDRVPLILDGGPTEVGLESTVTTFEDGIPKILRPGGITPDEICEIVGAVIVGDGVLGQTNQEKPVLSPGLKYKHYAPKADVILIKGSQKAYTDYCNSQKGEGIWAMAFHEDMDFLTIPSVSYGGQNNPEEQGRELFAKLRELDEKRAKKILVHAPSTTGVGLAVYNRLLRAASFHEVTL